MTPYDKLTKAIQEANPKLLELSFGCEVVWKGKRKLEVVIDRFLGKVNTSEGSIAKDYFDKHYKILGHPPTLEHVLVAIEKNSVISPLKVAVSGCIYDGEAGAPLVCWQLGLPLSDQSQELKDFLSKLLV